MCLKNIFCKEIYSIICWWQPQFEVPERITIGMMMRSADGWWFLWWIVLKEEKEQNKEIEGLLKEHDAT